LDFLARVKEYLEANVALNAPIVTPLLSTDTKSIAIRQTPSSANSRYMTGKTFNFNFQVLVKDTNHVKAYNTIQAIFKALDGLSKDSIVSNDGSFIMVKCECSTLPNFVEKTDKLEYIFTALFTAELSI
jgi:hypothetical protein